MNQSNGFLKDRRDAFVWVIERLDFRLSKARAGIRIASPRALDPSAHNAPQVETLELLRCGIAHVHNGAPNHAPGSLHAALSLSSLRRSSLAAALAINPPRFEQILIRADYSTGREAAICHIRTLIDVIETDIPASKKAIREKINQLELLEMGGINADDLRRQMAFDLNILCENYINTCADVRHDIHTL